MLPSFLDHVLVSFRRSPRLADDVRRDADDVIQIWGADAFDRAVDLASRERTGLLRSATPDHWQRVRNEVGRRLGERGLGAFAAQHRA